MRVVVGANHNGFPVRAAVVGWLQEFGHEVSDLGVFDDRPVDYPEIAAAVASSVSQGLAQRGILLGWTAIGMTVVANKFPGVRAAPCPNELTAELGRRHNDLNVLCLSAALIGRTLMRRIVEAWLSTPFDGGRHADRLAKIAGRELATAALARV